MSFGFFMPARVIGEKNAVLNNKDIFPSLGKSCLIICSKTSAKKSGALSDITKALDETGVKFSVFDGITQNPKVADCHAAGKTAREQGADFIIGVGGGSSLDGAKAAAVYAANPELESEEIYSGVISGAPLPLVLVGTTAGTGSEVTGVSVLTRESGVKKSVSGANFYAKYAFADPKYTYSLPYKFTVSTAADAFSHAMESLFSNKSSCVSKMYALKALPPLWRRLKAFYRCGELPTEEERDELYYSSLNAGMALNLTGTCYPHTLGYILTEDYGFPHGFACAVYLPSLLRRCKNYRPELYRELLEVLNTDENEFETVIFALADPSPVKMSEAQIEKYAQRWVNIKNFANSPGGFTANEAKNTLKEMFLR